MKAFVGAGTIFGVAELLVTAEVQDPDQTGRLVSNASERDVLPEVVVVDPTLDEHHATELAAANLRVQQAQERFKIAVRMQLLLELSSVI